MGRPSGIEFTKKTSRNHLGRTYPQTTTN